MIKKKYRRFFKTMGKFFLCSLGIVFIANAVLPDKGFSDMENRVLSSFPELNLSQITSGKYAKKFETYTNDQFLARNLFITLKADTDILLGKNESNGVYLGDDGYLIEDFASPRQERYEKNMSSIESFCSSHPDLTKYALIAPNACSILSEKLPAHAPIADENQYLNSFSSEASAMGINIIDVRSTLTEHKKEQLYYKTDHHWTTDSAYYSYLEAAKIMGLDTSLQSYDRLSVSKTFQGTLSAKSGFRPSETDEIYVYLPQDDTSFPYVVNYTEERTKSGSFYAAENLETRDKYALFFDGNHSKVIVSTPDAEDRTLLVFKDSYANCFIPFLAPHYRKIVIVDPRYYYGNIETEIVQSEGIQEVLFLYNANTFFSDTSLSMTLDI